MKLHDILRNPYSKYNYHCLVFKGWSALVKAYFFWALKSDNNSVESCREILFRFQWQIEKLWTSFFNTTAKFSEKSVKPQMIDIYGSYGWNF